MKRAFYKVKQLCDLEITETNRYTAKQLLEEFYQGVTKYGKPLRNKYTSRHKKGEVYRVRENSKWLGLALVANEVVFTEGPDIWSKERVMFLLTEEGERLLKNNVIKKKL